jgi:carbon monoxide dehydrogenase subunit G
MKYTNEIIINRPVTEVVEKFDSAENLFKWMNGLLEYEHISGESGRPGSKSKFVMKSGNRKMDMVETILSNNLPDEFSAVYEMKGLENIQVNHFTELSDNKTKYTCEAEFKFENFGMKLIGMLFPGAFKKQSYGFMKNFKEFVESE